MARRDGFTLVEMAVVLLVMGLVALAVFPALTAVRTSEQRSVTQSHLRVLMLATAAYAQANGCVPCPAAAGDSSTFGLIQGFGSATPCGSCAATPEGIAPFKSLGLPASTAKDGWGHWMTMRVDPALTVLPSNAANCAASNTCSVFVPPAAGCTSVDIANGFCPTTAQIGWSQKGMCAANLRGSAKANPIQVFTPPGATPQYAAVLFVSHGARGYGAYVAASGANALNGCRLPFPSATGAATGLCPPQPACASVSDCAKSQNPGDCYAQCNAAGLAQFADAAAGDSYDDMMIFADRNALVSQFGNGACQTVW